MQNYAEREGFPIETRLRIFRQTGRTALVAIIVGIRVLTTAPLSTGADSPPALLLWQVTNITTAAWSPTGDLIAAALPSGGVQLYEAQSGTAGLLLGQAEVWEANHKAISWSPDGSLLAGRVSLGNNRAATALVWDTTTGTERYLLQWEAGSPLAFSPDGTRLAGVSVWGEVLIWQALSGELKTHTPPQRETVKPYAVAWSSDGEMILYASKRGKRLGVTLVEAKLGDTLSHLKVPAGHTIPSAGWTLEGHPFATNDYSEYYEWDVNGSLITTEPINLRGDVLSFSPDDLWIAVNSVPPPYGDEPTDLRAGVVRLLDRKTFTLVGEIEAASGEMVVWLEWNPNGSQLATLSVGEFSSTLRVWALRPPWGSKQSQKE